ncbi:ATP-binding protein [Spirosoma utsteinense]|uniref:ATP-binding protein n=1 Tax=Spirosoma utsteinense TaxID=2585773 RepID=UPI0016456BB8|nr:ATP-binding protein [Spirosoma utsteinense]MBC3787517.1 signal transduction histidine kinase/DNA-binding response OmpR family regulator [Spirosoma utsteinense]
MITSVTPSYLQPDRLPSPGIRLNQLGPGQQNGHALFHGPVPAVTEVSMIPLSACNGKLFKWFLSLLLVLVGSLVAYATTMPTASQGILDLRTVDLSRQDVELRGEWKWYWQQLRSPGQPESYHEFTLFPQHWSSSTWHQQPLSNQGFATYALTVLLPSRTTALKMNVPDQYSSYRLFINGTEAARDGQPATTAAATIPHWSTQLIEVPATADTLQLLLQIANFEHAKGGGRGAIRIGNARQLSAVLATDSSLDLLLTGCLLMAGLFFLGLFGMGRTEWPMLYFSLFCLTYSYRIIGTDLYVFHTIFPDLPWGVTIRLEYISLYLSVGTFVVYTQSLYPQDTNPIITRIMAGLCFSAAATVLLLPPLLFTQLMNPFLMLMVIYIIYCTYVYWIAALHGRPGARYSLLATGLLMVMFGLIILQYFDLLTPPKALLFVGYLGFFFLKSLVLPYRYVFAFKEARHIEKQFLANMSHEIRTPLNAIVGFSNLLDTADLTPEQHEYVRDIQVAGKNLLRIVNDVLDISKIESGMVQVERIPFSIPSLVDSIRTMLLPTAAEKKLALTVSIDPTIPDTVLGDPTRLTQILLNLLSNAIKFTQHGHVALHIDKRSQTSDSVRIRITVEDTGIGMMPDVLPHIFTRFRQANDSTTRHYGGTGLGLSIAKSLVELQGGWIRVSSEPDKGSKFTLEITYQIAQTQTDLPQDQDDTSWEPTGRRLSILVVEDNAMNQKLTIGILKRLGYTTQLAENGSQALDILKNADFDLILMDIQMPIMDGYTATHQIRTVLQKKTPIIAMTAHAMASEREKCLKAGMNDFLSKPFLPNDLQLLIQEYVLLQSAGELLTKPVSAAPFLTFSEEPLMEAVEGDTKLVISLLTVFLDQTPSQLQAVRQALGYGDLPTVSRIVHLQKATIQLLGLTEARQQIQRIETQFSAGATRAEITRSTQDYLAQIDRALPAIQARLDEMIMR